MKTSFAKVLLWSPLLCWAIGSCGGVTDETLNFDSNTNWLKKCELDSDCDGGVLRCLCGICSQPCGTGAECGRLSGAACAESASDLCTGESSVGALCVLACSNDAPCQSGFECRSGQCVPTPQPAPPTRSNCQVTWDQVYASIEVDILQRDEEERPFIRYVSLANKQVAGQCGAALLDDRQLLASLMNSLSPQPTAVQPELIPGDPETFRIDLRDYDLDDSQGPFVVAQTSFADGWEAIAGNTPYAVEFKGDQAENVQLLTFTQYPVLFLDAVADGASAAGLPLNSPGFVGAVLAPFDLDVDLGTAAGDLLFPADLMVNEINRLDPALSGLDDGFKIDRDDWGGLYVNSLCVVSVANQNRPSDRACIDGGITP
jgi:hypothetical protein